MKNQARQKPDLGDYISEAFQMVDKHFHEYTHTEVAHDIQQHAVETEAEENISAQDFHDLAVHFKHETLEREREDNRVASEQRQKVVSELAKRHMDDNSWHAKLHHAREAARRGEKEYLLLRFPSELCTDAGRALNVAESGWKNTLRGEAAEVYERWETELKPQGFRLLARILEYPDGFPGDAGFFLMWGNV